MFEFDMRVIRLRPRFATQHLAISDLTGPGSPWVVTRQHDSQLRKAMSLILLIVLVVIVIGALPSWPYSRGWGYYPSGGLGLVLLILLILLLMGRI